MKSAPKKKSPTKSGKKKKPSATLPARKTASKKTGHSLSGKAAGRKAGTGKVTSAETGSLKQLHAENQQLAKQLAQKESELQIEAALEKVRSRSLRMHRSEEIRDVVKVVFDLLQELSFVLDDGAVSILIFKENSKDHTQWIADPGHSYATSFEVAYSEHSLSTDLINAKNSGVDFFSKLYPTREKNEYFNYLFTHSDYKHLPDEVKQLMLGSTKYGISVAFAKHSAILIPTNSGRLLTTPKIEILRRFVHVFDQSYTRFLDLQKAEAQAREAEIQLALEKVRARTMSMRQSDELREVVALLFEQLKGLGFDAFMCSILLQDKTTRGYREITSSDMQTGLPQIYNIPYFEDALFDKFIAAFDEGVAYKVFELGGLEKKEYDRKFFTLTDYRFAPEESKQMMMNVQRCSLCCAYMKHGCIVAMGDQELGADQAEILQRFAKVFEQTYTRFLDLQKAEAQAREAQIEAALEKIRSTSLAMHHSDELGEVVATLFEKLGELEIKFDAALIYVFDKESHDIDLWVFGKGVEKIRLPGDQDAATIKVIQDFWEAERTGEHIINRVYSGRQKNDYLNYTFKHNTSSEIHVALRATMLAAPSWTVTLAAGKNALVGIDSWSGLVTSEQDFETLKRFGKVFEQTYTRFLDLQKAEAQAREAKVEAALERIRSSAMAMHSSEAILEVTQVLREQIALLGEKELESILVHIYHEDTDQFEAWYSYRHPENIDEPIRNGRHMLSWSQTARARKDKEKYYEDASDYTIAADYNMLKEWYEYLSEVIPEVVEVSKDGKPLVPDVLYYNYSKISGGTLLLITNSEASEHSKYLLRRAATVFNLAYSRFLDLQKAEAQAREAKIEAALERIRARALAMHTSKDLIDVANVLRDQMGLLGQPELESSIVHLYHDDSEMLDAWYAYRPPNISSGEIITGVASVHRNSSAWSREVFACYQSPEKEYTIVASGDKIKEWYKVLEAAAPAVLEYDGRGQLIVPEILYYHFSKFSGGALLMISNQQPSAEAKELQKRAALVFGLAVTRFMDLKKAEAQAREALIEAALERVRSRTMAMQKSDELADVAGLMFRQVKDLGIITWTTGFNVWSEDNNSYTDYITTPQGGLIEPYTIDAREFPAFKEVSDAKKRGDEFFVQYLEGDPLRETYLELGKYGDKEQYVKMLEGGFEFPTRQYDHFVFLSNISLMFITYEPVPDAHEIFKRFGKVFEQTYTRFLDLQRAEVQAKEALVEAALERVRGKAMAMHSSEDLTATISAFYHELELFSITPRRCGVGLLDKATHMAELSTMNTTDQGRTLEIVGTLKMTGHPVLEGVFDHWLRQEEYHPVLRGNEIKEYYQLLRPQISFPDYPKDTIQFGYFFFFPEGGVYAWTEKELIEDELKIYRRFTSVLSLAYKRYKDLKDAEVRAREAVKQAALDRVRADIASMRTTSDLDRITPLIWKELTTLGIPFIRCGVFIMDEKENRVHTYLSTPDGRAIGAFHVPFESSGRLSEVIANWRLQKVYVARWDDQDFQAQADILAGLGAIASRGDYLNNIPKGGFHLHFLPFVQGMLYVGSLAPLHQDDLLLVQSLAEAFSVAYARYEDFTRLEEAKKSIEVTLSDLRAAQSQLIQSEKMASLGELTAGIAHEIQNPLNFVNNFSEVSNELLEEMEQEIQKGNIKEAEAIVLDVKQNLEKILHHGKRADGIVKGMLQHSRSNSGQKEPTDINALCDEYLRLSYHGLRAKDKTFNAKFETDFDTSIGKQNVVPQDIGRVILNLINNAFYAVSEKKKVLDGQAGYDPTVTVITKMSDNRFEIRVKDNGNGIPQKVLDKIFQPFFTTKPTGQGTGLGLSLSYDIVKAHGGELRVETNEGGGSEFVVTFPG